MATLTIRNLPEDLHAMLKERARKNRRSLNQEVIAVLVDRAAAREKAEENKFRAEQMIARVEELRKGMTRFMTAEEIDAAKTEGRR